jgi:hypothetical protein
MIGVLMISDLLYDGSRFMLITAHGNPGDLHYFNSSTFGQEFLWTPVTILAGQCDIRIFRRGAWNGSWC